MSMQDEQQQQETPAELRAAAERGRAAEARAEQAERKIAMLEAGVPTNDPIGAMFVETYKGDLKVDKIKEAWEAIAPPAPPATTEVEQQAATQQQEQQEQETQQRRLLTTGGAGDSVNEPPPVDPIKAGYDQYNERLANGEGRAQAAGSVFGHLIAAANDGDPAATWTGWTPEQLA